MKKSILVASLSFFFSLTTLSSSETLYNTLRDARTPDFSASFSFCPIRDQPEGSKKKQWATYKQSYGFEKVRVRFPTPPRIIQERGTVFTCSTRKETHYTLIAGMPPVGGIKSKDAFPIALAALCQHPAQLVDYHISKCEGRHILDTITENSLNGTMTRSRMIISKRNFYVLSTVYKHGSRQDHEYFVDSFELTE